MLDANARAGGGELDLIVRRGRRLVFAEVKMKSGRRFGDPLEMIDQEKVGRLVRAAEGWLARRPELAGLELAFEAVAVRRGRIERVPFLPQL